MAITFKALQAVEADGRFDMSVVTKSTDELPDGDVLIKVRYSSLNYKDAMSASGNKSITKHYPHTPGIDVAGIVEESSVGEWKAGDEVVVTGFDLGMNTSGGFGGYVRVPAAWVVRLPGGLSLRESMIYGTAGTTIRESKRSKLLIFSEYREFLFLPTTQKTANFDLLWWSKRWSKFRRYLSPPFDLNWH